jgi:hypothetical protein
LNPQNLCEGDDSMTALDTLVELRKTYPTPMSNSQLGELLNAVAWKHRAEGYGLLAKPNGAHCLQPQTGTLVARDILASTAGKHFDVLVDAEGAAKPVWQDKGAYQSSRFVSPVDSTVLLPHTPAQPPAQPPTTPAIKQSYPDEATWWTALFEEIEGLYGLANHPHDLGTFKWSARTAYDIGAGMDKDKAKAKHLAELRAALGLGSSR